MELIAGIKSLFNFKRVEYWEIQTNSGSRYTLLREKKSWFLLKDHNGNIKSLQIYSFGSKTPQEVTDLNTIIGKNVFFIDGEKRGRTSTVVKVKKL